jgi:hypothetical protein
MSGLIALGSGQPTSITPPTSGLKLVPLPESPELVEPPDTADKLVVPEAGPRGLPGLAGDVVFEYLMPVAQTTALIEHPLGRDPVVVQVIDPATSAEVDEYEVVFVTPGQRVRVAFDIAAQLLIRLK